MAEPTSEWLAEQEWWELSAVGFRVESHAPYRCHPDDCLCCLCREVKQG